MLSNTYVRLPMTVAKAKGALVFDNEGKTYIDLLSARSAGNLGYGNEAVINAIKAQAELLVHYSNDFHVDVQNRLNDVLVDFFPESLDHFYFSNSGTEIVEAAIKLARVRTGRKRVIGFSRGFHGSPHGGFIANVESNHTRSFRTVGSRLYGNR